MSSKIMHEKWEGVAEDIKMCLPQGFPGAYADVLMGKRYDQEEFWVEWYPFLLSLGYRLRPRYDPDWLPSWSKDMGKRPFIRMLLHEDALHLYCALRLVNDGTRLSDGQKVVFKLVDYASTETTISRYFSEEPQRSDPRNHCVPILDVISLPNHPSKALLVMPLLYAFDRLPFRRVGEFAEAMQQFIESLQFMHEHRIAHKAACRPNLVMDASKVIPKGFHFQRPNTHDGVTRKFDWLERWSVKPNKYYLTNFASSELYPEEPSETSIDPQAEAEVVNLLQCDPFKQDVKQLGATLLRVVQEHQGLEPFLPILELMTLPDPKARPSPDELLKLLAKLTSRELQRRVCRREDSLGARLRMRASRLFSAVCALPGRLLNFLCKFLG